MGPSDVVVVLVTAPDVAVAERLGRAVVEERLAACVNVVGPIRSIYRWEGAVVDEPEHLLIAKTVRPLVARLEAAIRSLHPYDVPEVVVLPVIGGSAAYLAWVTAAVDATTR